MMELNSLLFTANIVVTKSIYLQDLCTSHPANNSNFRLCYQIIGYVKTIASLEPTFCVDFPCEYVKSPAPKVAPLATLKERITALELVLVEVLPLLREDVKITSLWITAGVDIYNVHVHDLPLEDWDPDPEFRYAFIRFVVPTESKDPSTYEKGDISDLLRFRLNEAEIAVLSSFTEAFLLFFALSDECLVLQAVPDNDLM
jgi:hypothetical protein